MSKTKINRLSGRISHCYNTLRRLTWLYADNRGFEKGAARWRLLASQFRSGPKTIQQINLVARDTRTSLFLVSFSRQCRLQFRLLTRRHKERMLLRVLDNLLGHHTTLKAPQCAFNRLTLINCNNRHTLSTNLRQNSNYDNPK
jgi:hypothetical protein